MVKIGSQVVAVAGPQYSSPVEMTQKSVNSIDTRQELAELVKRRAEIAVSTIFFIFNAYHAKIIMESVKTYPFSGR